MGRKLTTEQWEVISFSEQYWRENGFFPSFGEISMDTQLSAQEVEEIVFDELTQKHLSARGIDWKLDRPVSESSASEKRSGRMRRLTDIQIATVSTILNPADGRSVSQKLEDLGVAASTYANWKKSRVFADYMKRQGEALFGEFMPDMENALVTRAKNGNIPALKFAFEVSGRYRPNQGEEQANVKMLMIKLIEIIQLHVKDPLTLQNIARDIKTLQSGVEVGGQQINGNNDKVRVISPSRE